MSFVQLLILLYSKKNFFFKSCLENKCWLPWKYSQNFDFPNNVFPYNNLKLTK